MAYRLDTYLAPHQQSEVQVEFFNQTKKWPNGKRTTRILSPFFGRTWKIAWDGLTLAEALILESHFGQVGGTTFVWEYQDIHTKSVHFVRYLTQYKRLSVRPGVMLFKVNHTIEEDT